MSTTKLSELISTLDVIEALELGASMVAANVPVEEYQQEIMEGLQAIGTMYEHGECYIADLMVSGMLARELFALKKNDDLPDIGTVIGRVVIGTICEDIHDIGKNLVADALRFRCVEVIDLGVDVSVDRFVEAAERYQPDMLAVSTLIDGQFGHIRELVDRLKASKAPEDMCIVIGGAAADPRFVSIPGVDCITNNYQDAMSRIVELITERGRRRAASGFEGSGGEPYLLADIGDGSMHL